MGFCAHVLFFGGGTSKEIKPLKFVETAFKNMLATKMPSHVTKQLTHHNSLCIPFVKSHALKWPLTSLTNIFIIVFTSSRKQDFFRDFQIYQWKLITSKIKQDFAEFDDSDSAKVLLDEQGYIVTRYMFDVFLNLATDKTFEVVLRAARGKESEMITVCSEGWLGDW